MNHFATATVLCALLFSANICAAADAKPASPQSTAPAAPLDPHSAALEQALESWIVALEKNDQAAVAQWTKDEKTKSEVEKNWKFVKEAHAAHNYRTILPDAQKIGDKTAFTVGSHKWNHMHTEWKKTAKGWRIASVWMCR